MRQGGTSPTTRQIRKRPELTGASRGATKSEAAYGRAKAAGKAQAQKAKASNEATKRAAAKKAAAKKTAAAKKATATGKAKAKTIAATNINVKGVTKALGKGAAGKRKVDLTRPAKTTYAEAKKKNSNLDKLIARRKNLTKGTPGYNAVQNKINAAYGRGPRRDASITKLASKKAGPVSSGAKPKLQVKKPVAKPLTPAEKRKKATAARKSTRGNKKDVKQSKRGLSKSMRQIKAVGRKAARSRKQIIRKARR